MSRFWHERKKTAKARELLLGVYGGFEGEPDDSADLVESRELLEQLDGSARR